MAKEKDMPRIRLLEIAEATGTVKEVYGDIQRARGEGRVSNLFKAYAAFPELLAANWERMKVLMAGGSLSRKLKECVMIALAEINRCTYWIAFHGTALRVEGATDEEIGAARRTRIDEVALSPMERRLFDFALKAREDPHSVGDADMEALRALGAADQHIVEVLEVMNFGNSINLFCDTLDIQADPFLTYAVEPSTQR